MISAFVACVTVAFFVAIAANIAESVVSASALA